MSKLHGVFSFEGDWETRLDDKKSVLPLLDTLQRVEGMRFIHRRIGTVPELDHYLKKWLQRGYDHYSIGQFGFHGAPGGIWIGEEWLSLEDLAEKIDGRADRRVVFFDSCKTLKVRDTRIKKFLSDTGAKAVIGYTKDVEWIASAAFELMIFEAFCYRTQMRAVKNMLWTNYPGMVKKLGMKFEYR